jgi:hypothetical protein
VVHFAGHVKTHIVQHAQQPAPLRPAVK